jgi:hypothetical protein
VTERHHQAVTKQGRQTHSGDPWSIENPGPGPGRSTGTVRGCSEARSEDAEGVPAGSCRSSRMTGAEGVAEDVARFLGESTRRTELVVRPSATPAPIHFLVCSRYRWSPESGDDRLPSATPSASRMPMGLLLCDTGRRCGPVTEVSVPHRPQCAGERPELVIFARKGAARSRAPIASNVSAAKA